MLMIPMVHAAPEFKEGVNYDVVKQTGSAQPEVLEFFSYYCPHCAKFEPIAEDLKKNLPEGVPMKKTRWPSWAARWVRRCSVPTPLPAC